MKPAEIGYVPPMWTDINGEFRETKPQRQSWEEWCAHVEEITGLRSPAWTDEGLTAWEHGEEATAFAQDWIANDARAAGADTRAVPFTEPDDPSSPLLSAGALLVAAFVCTLLLASLFLWGSA